MLAVRDYLKNTEASVTVSLKELWQILQDTQKYLPTNFLIKLHKNCSRRLLMHF